MVRRELPVSQGRKVLRGRKASRAPWVRWDRLDPSGRQGRRAWRVGRELPVSRERKVLKGRKASQVLRALQDWMASSVPRGIQDRLA